MPQQYRTFGGTSMAAPFVAGIAALHLESAPEMTARELWMRLTQTARRLDLPAADVGAGLVQAP
jgi:subtilisin family serine protease